MKKNDFRIVGSTDNPYPGVKVLSIPEMVDLWKKPGMPEALELARKYGGQYKYGAYNSAINEMVNRNTRSARLHDQELNRVAVLRARAEREQRTATYLNMSN